LIGGSGKPPKSDEDYEEEDYHVDYDYNYENDYENDYDEKKNYMMNCLQIIYLYVRRMIN
jgi:hypothetical protein